MNNKKVVILMSTYNGEKYIADQLMSLINQTYQNIKIIIRDDGSKDHTTEILREFSKNNKNVFVEEGNNLGFINSFFKLLEIADNDADYYAYCDQDDIWMEDKIERAVYLLNNTNKNKPALFFSNSDYYDSNMNFIASADKNKVYNFRNSLVECVTQGMTMVINNTTRRYIIQNIPKNCLYHDWWTYMICSGFGEIIYDSKSLVKYRRHTKSVTVEGKNALQLFIFRIKKFIIGDSLKQIKKQWKEFETFYYDNLNDNDKKLLKMFTHKYTFFIALKKVFYPMRFRRKIIDEINLRVLFLIGKL